MASVVLIPVDLNPKTLEAMLHNLLSWDRFPARSSNMFLFCAGPRILHDAAACLVHAG
jgi:hypothetical protein